MTRQYQLPSQEVYRNSWHVQARRRIGWWVLRRQHRYSVCWAASHSGWLFTSLMSAGFPKALTWITLSESSSHGSIPMAWLSLLNRQADLGTGINNRCYVYHWLGTRMPTVCSKGKLNGIQFRPRDQLGFQAFILNNTSILQKPTEQ